MPMNIAIVDDNLTNLMIVEKIMKQAGYHKLELLSSARSYINICNSMRQILLKCQLI